MKLLFCGEKVLWFNIFLSFPEKLLRLPVILPILGTLDSNIHGKTCVVTKQSAKTVKLFHSKTKAIYGVSLTTLEVHMVNVSYGFSKKGFYAATLQ